MGISYQAVRLWTRVPVERVHAVEAFTKIPRHVLRPDVYPLEREKRQSR